MNYIKLEAKERETLKQILRANDFSERAIKDIIESGYYLNNDLLYKNIELKENDQIKVPIPAEDLDYEPIEGALDIVYEDEHILVINKKSGLTVNSKNQISLANHIASYFKENNIKSKIRFVNRLDMNTSGLIMIAKNKFAQSYYQKQIEENNFRKLYIAVVAGELDIDREVRVFLSYDKDSKRYNVSSEGELAITYFRTRACSINKKVCFIMADIKTGKTHQIRSSLAYLGHPIIGDKLYGSDIDLDRFLLHAYSIDFKKFLTNESVSLLSKPDFPDIKEII